MIRAHRVLPVAFLVSLILSGCTDNAMQPGNEDVAPPPVLSLAFTTDDSADHIDLSSQLDDVQAKVRICLRVATTSGWWKGVGINQTEPTLEGAKEDGVQCTNVAPGNLTLTFWKAKGLGVHSRVGSGSVDLTRYAGHLIWITWTKD